MPSIKLKSIISFSSEDKNYPAENLLLEEHYRKWKCASAGEKQVSVVIEFEKATRIHGIDIGNEGSAFVEVLVGRTEKRDEFKVLLVASSFMSPSESKSSTNMNRVRMFSYDKLTQNIADEKWNSAKIVCTQPFNKNVQFGISFIKFHSPSENAPASATKQTTLKIGAFTLKDDNSDAIRTGEFFAKRKDDSTTTLNAAAAIRAASAALEESIQKKNEQQSTSVNKETKPSSDKPRANKAPPSERTAEKKRHGSHSSHSENKTKNTTTKVETPPQKAVFEKPKKDEKPQSVPYKEILKGVKFVLSGFQNPYRAEIREKAMSMGASYQPDWNNKCTHLICAFANTPKFLEVQGKGGKIVKKEWILECQKQKKLLSWESFALDKQNMATNSVPRQSPSTLRKPDPSPSTSRKRDSSPSTSRKRDSSPSTSRKRDSSPSTSSRRDSSPSTSKQKKQKLESKTLSTPSSSSKGKKTSTSAASPDDMKDNHKAHEVCDDDSDKYSGTTDIMETQSLLESGSDTEDEIRQFQNGNADMEVDDYDADTDIDEDMGVDSSSKLTWPDLPNLFTGMHFFLYGNMKEVVYSRVCRCVIAFDGEIEKLMNDEVSHVVTSENWSQDFDEAKSENPELMFVRPAWIFACVKSQRLVPWNLYEVCK